MRTSGTISHKVHGIDKGVDPNLWPEKEVKKPLSTPVQSHVATGRKVKSMQNQA